MLEEYSGSSDIRVFQCGMPVLPQQKHPTPSE
jgi:hypothetical protein